MKNHLPVDLKALVNLRGREQNEYWSQELRKNPRWRRYKQMAYQTVENKTVFVLNSGRPSDRCYYVTPDVVRLFHNDPDAMAREFRRLAEEGCFPVMPNQAHPASLHILGLSYDNERRIYGGHEKKWEHRQYTKGRWQYHGIGYESEGKFFIVNPDGSLFETIRL